MSARKSSRRRSPSLRMVVSYIMICVAKSQSDSCKTCQRFEATISFNFDPEWHTPCYFLCSCVITWGRICHRGFVLWGSWEALGWELIARTSAKGIPLPAGTGKLT